jgi:nucleoid DNA-binding protein
VGEKRKSKQGIVRFHISRKLSRSKEVIEIKGLGGFVMREHKTCTGRNLKALYENEGKSIWSIARESTRDRSHFMH